MVNYTTYIKIFLEDINKQVSLNEFEKYFNRPHQTIRIHLKQLTDKKILIQDKRERFLFYKLNLDNPLTYEFIVICEKHRLIDFLDKELFYQLYVALNPFFNQAKILLFGSATYKKEYSDIDLLVLSKNKDIKRILEKFELTYSVKIHAIFSEEKYLTKTFIKELQKKHIIINEHEYYVRLLYSP